MPRFVRHSSRLALVALVCLGQSASAETVGLSPLAPAQSPVPADEVATAVRLALTGGGHQVIADPIAFAQKQVQLGAVVADRLLPFARAEALAAEGWQAYALVDNETARARLRAAFVAALSVADLAGGVELVAETALRLAVIEFELGDATSSSANFRLAQRLAPDRAVTDNEFKPAVVTAFQAAVSAPTVKRAVSVVIEPSDATVEVDGTTRVTSGSGTSLDLEVGLHLVVVSAPSLNAESTIAVVPSGGPATIGAKLTRDRDVTGVFSPPPEVGMASADATSVIEATSLFAEVDSTVLVAAVWRERDPALIGQRCSGTPIRCGAVVEIRFPNRSGPGNAIRSGDGKTNKTNNAGLRVAATELVSALEAQAVSDSPLLITTDARVTGSVEPAPIVIVTPKRAWWNNRWLWVGVGAAAVATTGTVLWLTHDPESNLVIVADPCQFGQC